QLGQVSIAGVSGRDARAVLARARHVGVGALDEVDDGALVTFVSVLLSFTFFLPILFSYTSQQGKKK
ncbi:hypothetical protein OFC46_25480, partial [Escherichia coli]|nr:hypothetical protein [Escherichia coli]